MYSQSHILVYLYIYVILERQNYNFTYKLYIYVYIHNEHFPTPIIILQTLAFSVYKIFHHLYIIKLVFYLLLDL